MRAAGWIAALLVTLCAPVIWYEGWILPTTMNLLLLVIGLNLLCGVSYQRAFEPPGAVGCRRHTAGPVDEEPDPLGFDPLCQFALGVG